VNDLDKYGNLVTERERARRSLADFAVWYSQFQRLFGARSAEVSTTLLGLLFEEGETPEGAARWARIADGQDVTSSTLDEVNALRTGGAA
jgi:hypothetical protein